MSEREGSQRERGAATPVRPRRPDRQEERAAVPVVVFVGISGAGKTTVGRLVAQRLGVEFLDTDAAI
jgi:adenylylsulfate kinase-like enzyme